MRTVDLSFIQNEVKSEALRSAIISHGLGNQSAASEIVNHLQKMEEGMRNSTESRMTMYTSEINPFLYPDNSFVTRSQNDAAFAASGETKRLNDANEAPNGTKGRVYAKTLANGDTVSAASVKIRKNTGHDWTIEYFHVDPEVLTQELTSEVPYDTRSNLLQGQAEVLNRMTANYAAVEWSPGEVGVAETGVDTGTGSTNTSFVFSSGSSTRTNAVVGTTGTVKRLAQADLKKAKSNLIKQQISKGRNIGGTLYALPTAEQWDDMQDPTLFPDLISYEKTGRQNLLDKGEVGMMYGITILDPRIREDWGANIVYSFTALSGTTTDLTKIEDTASTGADMVSVMLVWADNMVLRAEGSALVFPWLNSPTYYGDVYSSELRFGAKKKRLDGKGVVAIVENPFTATQG